MNLTVQLKLTPVPTDATALVSTLELCNQAADDVSEVAWTRRTFRNYRLRRPQRVTLSSWAFHQLGGFIASKARRVGVPVVYVDPAYTSRTCADCGHIDPRNRVSQAWFVCRSCGVVAHADRNASRNIGHRAGVVWDAGRQSSAPAA